MNITIRNIILEYCHRPLGESEFVMGDVTIGYFRKLRSWIRYIWMYDVLATIYEFEYMTWWLVCTTATAALKKTLVPTDVQKWHLVSFSNTSVDMHIMCAYFFSELSFSSGACYCLYIHSSCSFCCLYMHGTILVVVCTCTAQFLFMLLFVHIWHNSCSCCCLYMYGTILVHVIVCTCMAQFLFMLLFVYVRHNSCSCYCLYIYGTILVRVVVCTCTAQFLFMLLFVHAWHNSYSCCCLYMYGTILVHVIVCTYMAQFLFMLVFVHAWHNSCSWFTRINKCCKTFLPL